MFLQSYCYSSGLHPLGAQRASGLVIKYNQPTNVVRSGANLSSKKYPFGGSGSFATQFSSQPTVVSTSYSDGDLVSDTNISPLQGPKEAVKNRAQRQSLKTKKGFRSNDNLADLLSRIRNGYFRSFEDILVIDSKQNRELLDALICTGYIYN